MASTGSTSVCVFCGSSPGKNDVYVQIGQALGNALAGAQMRLVYGGGNKGIMGAVAAGVATKGGKVLGVIPETMLSGPAKGHPDTEPITAVPKSAEGRGQTLLDAETSQEGQVETVVVDSMHTRKLRMAQETDAFVVLPGGFGTFEEAFEMITWSQIGIHRKPVIIVNPNGFFDPLVALIKKGTEEGFIPAASTGIVHVVDQADGGSPVDLAQDTIKVTKESLEQIQYWQGGYWSWGSRVKTTRLLDEY